jgi:hypothetical protein
MLFKTETVRVTGHKLNDLDPEVHEVTLQIERDPVTLDQAGYLEDMPLGLITLFVEDRRMIEALQLGNGFRFDLTPITE